MTELDPRSRLEAQFQKTLDGLEAAWRVGGILGETFEEGLICERAVEIFVEHLPFENCSILLLDDSRSVLRLRAAAGKSDPGGDATRFNRALEFRVGEGVAGEVVDTGRPMLLRHADRHPQFKSLPSRIPIRSLLCLPIHGRGDEVLGVLNLSHPEIEEISTEQGKALEVLARLVGQNLTISRLSFELIAERLSRSERLIALGHLSAAVAHEVNNPLTNILLRAQKLQGFEGLDARHRDMTREIARESEKIAGILGNVLDFSRDRRAESRPFDVHECLGRVLGLTVPLHTSRTKLEVREDLAADLPPAQADPHEIEQVFTNLVINAIQAMGSRGTLSIRTTARDREIEIAFRDDGRGIDERKLDRIFEPFYTTREEEGGTGLGLAVCRQLVRRHRGDLRVSSRVGEGSVFTVVLPAAIANGR